MLNWIWLGLMVGAVLIGGWNGRLRDVGDKSLEWANTAVVGIAFSLIGVMALWLGIMRLAERAGLVTLFARAMRPLMRLIFPDVPAEHPAIGSMLMNIAANMLGLNNAATPLGLRAMKDLESLNPCPGTATNAMCTFLAINTSGIQLIPVTAIAILVANKSTDPTAIVGTSIICTACAAVSGVLMAKFLSRLPVFRVRENFNAGGGRGHAAFASARRDPESLAEKPIAAETGKTIGGFLPAAGGVPAVESGRQTIPTPAPVQNAPQNLGGRDATKEKAPVKEADALRPLPSWAGAALGLFLLFFIFLFLRLVFPGAFGQGLDGEPPGQNLFIRGISAVSLLSIPFLLSAIPLFAILRGVKVYEEFVDGAKEGFDVAIKIIPYLVAMLVAVGMFRAAGGIDMLSRALAPVFNKTGFPTDLLPMVLVRPLSGSGSLGFFTEVVKNFGPDSLIARMGGTIYGSTETTFYVLAVYFGSVAVKRTRHAVLAGLTADFVSVVVAVFVCRIVFR